MSAKMIHKVIHEPIFQTETLFYACTDIDTVISHAKKTYKVHLDKGEFEGATGICQKFSSDEKIARKLKNHCWVVWLEIPHDLRLTVHEAGHLTYNILNHHGVNHDFDNQETFCYLLDFFTNEFWNLMENSNKKKKGLND